MGCSRRALASVLALLVVLPGCTARSLARDFEPAGRAPGGPLAEHLEIVLEPDARPLRGRSSVGGYYKALIPLMPYGEQNLDPHFGAYKAWEGVGGFPAEVQHTILNDLRAAGLARRVEIGGELLPGQRAPERAHELRLSVTEGVMNRRATLYGVSLAGALLWIVGAPVSFGDSVLAFDVTIVGPDGNELARRSFADEEGAVETLYFTGARSYSNALIEAYARISPELRAFVGQTLVR